MIHEWELVLGIVLGMIVGYIWGWLNAKEKVNYTENDGVRR